MTDRFDNLARQKRETDMELDGPSHVRLGENLRERLTAYAVISCKSPADDAYCAALGAHSGEVVRVERTWFGPVPTQPELRGRPALPYAYNVEVGGKLYHLPALFGEPCEAPTAPTRRDTQASPCEENNA